MVVHCGVRVVQFAAIAGIVDIPAKANKGNRVQRSIDWFKPITSSSIDLRLQEFC